jgi:hypothetical protein
VDHRLRRHVGARVIAVSYPLNKVLTGLARAHVTRERLSDAEVAGQDLSADERAALLAGDIRRLYALGANPYLIRRVFRPRFAI